MTKQSLKPHERLDQAMNVRRLQLGLTWDDLADKAGITSAGLRAIRSGKNRGRELTRRKIDAALQWEAGTLDAIFEDRIDPNEAPETEGRAVDDEAPVTRGEFRAFLAILQDPDAELPESALKKLRALGVDPERIKKPKRGTR